jgi:long-chain acyl-CoA synthetase
MNSASLLDDHINRLGEIPFLIFNDKEYSNNWIVENANRLGVALKSLGVGKGDRVAVSLPNSPEVIVAFQAIFRIGAIIVPAMYQLGTEETGFILSDSGAKVFMTGHDLQEKIQMARDLDSVSHVVVVGGGEQGPGMHPYKELINQHSDKLDMEGMDDDEIALVIYTSGTTGRPKGVMLSHGAVYHQAHATRMLWDPDMDRRILCCMPLAHVYGVMTMILGLMSETPNSILVMTSGFNPEEIFRLIEKYKLLSLGGVPTMFWMMLHDPSIDKYDLGSLEWLVAGAAPVPEELRKDFKNKLKVEMVEAYGLSECCGGATCNRYGQAPKTGSAGTAVEGAVIKIFDDDDNELPPGEPGEIVIRGPMVMKGYYNRPEETDEALRGGWLHTGDMGYLDEEGYLYLTDRKKDMIIKGGENIYPSEVEDVLFRHPDVAEVSVIGIPDEKYGEEVMAFIVKWPDKEVTGEEIISFCRDHYTKFKSPSKVKFVDSLPKSLIGKVLKKELKKLI